MADNFQKTPLVRSLNAMAVARALDKIAELGLSLPASVVAVSGSIVTVKFEVASVQLPNVTVPKTESEYIRTPTQVGDRGMVVPADAYLGGMSGLGGGTATLSLQANLSALVWLPVANSSFSAPDDPNEVLLYGPDGVRIRTVAKDSYITVKTGVVTLHGVSIVLDGPVTFTGQATGIGGLINFGNTQLQTTGAVATGNLSATGTMMNNGTNVGSTHVHGGVTTGGGDTGTPI